MADKINATGSGAGAGRKVLTMVKGTVKTLKHGSGIYDALPPTKKGGK